MAKHTEQGNGITLVDKSNRYNLTIMNTMFTPKTEEKEKVATWTSGGWRNTQTTGLHNNKRKIKLG